jgi:hypothetical protein
MRGCAYEPELRAVSPAVEREFGFAEMPVLSFADLYGGKIVAALDRQHPRDLFDIKDLLANEGIQDTTRAAFIVYLLSHGRPMAEVLAARPKDVGPAFASGFQGMTEKPVTQKQLLSARSALIDAAVKHMPAKHRKFLIAFEAGGPDWSLLDVAGADKLPAVKWRQQNLDKLSEQKRTQLVAQLQSVLERDA